MTLENGNVIGMMAEEFRGYVIGMMTEEFGRYAVGIWPRNTMKRICNVKDRFSARNQVLQYVDQILVTSHSNSQYATYHYRNVKAMHCCQH